MLFLTQSDRFKKKELITRSMLSTYYAVCNLEKYADSEHTCIESLFSCNNTTRVREQRDLRFGASGYLLLRSGLPLPSLH